MQMLLTIEEKKFIDVQIKIIRKKGFTDERLNKLYTTLLHFLYLNGLWLRETRQSYQKKSIWDKTRDDKEELELPAIFDIEGEGNDDGD